MLKYNILHSEGDFLRIFSTTDFFVLRDYIEAHNLEIGDAQMIKNKEQNKDDEEVMI